MRPLLLATLAFSTLAVSGCLTAPQGGASDDPCPARALCHGVQLGVGEPVLRDAIVHELETSRWSSTPIPAAIHVFVQEPLITISNATINARTNGIYIFDSYGCDHCTLRLENVTVVGASANGNYTGIIHEVTSGRTSSTRLEVSNVTIAGFHTGAEFRGLGASLANPVAIEMANVEVACQEEGLLVHAWDVTITSLTVSGCRGTGAWVDVWHRADIRCSLFAGSKEGLRLHVEDGSVATLSGVAFVGNQLLGLATQQLGRVEGRELTFEANGAGSAGLGLGQPAPGGAQMLTSGFLVDSNFVGNTGFGLNAPFEVGYDATQNYWGDAAGPRVYQPPVGNVGAGSGDSWAGTPQVVPFRDAPVTPHC